MSGAEDIGRREGRSRIKDLLWGVGLSLSVLAAEAAIEAFFGERPRPAPDRGAQYRRELREYLVGIGLAILLTLIPFGLVHWSVLSRSGLYFAIGACALVQGAVHLRCFLHIDPPRQNADDLHLVLFTSLILFLMVGGTVWILGNLATRMH